MDISKPYQALEFDMLDLNPILHFYILKLSSIFLSNYNFIIHLMKFMRVQIHTNIAEVHLNDVVKVQS